MQTPPGHYELAVAYRVCPRLSRAAEPFGLSKLDFTSLCLRSFRESLGPLRTKIWAILDDCPAEYEDLFRGHFREEDLEIVRFPHAGNAKTFMAQVDILTRQKDAPLVYFAEDDYLYRPGMLAVMAGFIASHPDVDFVSPFDHPDYYSLPLTRPRTVLRVYGSSHWRTAGSTCLTFLTRRETLEHTRSIFGTYARRNYDSSLWLMLTKQRILNPFALLRLLGGTRVERMTAAKAWFFGWRQLLFGRAWKLWTPVPSMGTHVVSGGLARGVDWTLYGLPESRVTARPEARDSLNIETAGERKGVR